VAGFSFGAVKVLDLNEKVDNSLSPGLPHILQLAGSSACDKAFRASNSCLQVLQ
jgi:hypothetical protein